MFWQPIRDLHVNRRDEQAVVDSGTPSGAEDRPYVGQPISQRHILLVAFFVGIGLCILVGRAFFLQVMVGDQYRALAEGNRVRSRVIIAPRGVLYDQYGRQLTENSPELALALIPFDVPRDDQNREQLFQTVSLASGAPLTLFDEAWAQLSTEKRNRPDPVILDFPLDPELGLRLRLVSSQWQGVSVVTIPRRRLAPAVPASLSHVIGYVGRVGENNLADVEAGYSSQDIVGKNGLELFYEAVLKGENGRRDIEVNALGEEQPLERETAAIPGESIWLSIDAELQRVAEDSLKRNLDRAHAQRGAVVVLDPRDGQVYALVSWPTFDANAFNAGLSNEEYQALQADENHPLFQRAIQGTYPSGSTIKLVVAAAALAEKVITPNTTVLSVGGIRVGQWFFPDWKAGGHGLTDVRKAIAESVNTFFYIAGGGYQDAPGLGIERLSKWAKQFGLSAETGIDLAGEADGLFPSPEWKEATKDEVWYIGDTYHAAIGQGDVLVTPLQVANYTSVFANGGTLWKPRLAKEIVMSSGQERRREEPEALRRDVVGPEVLTPVRQGMRQGVTAGSSRFLNDLPIEVAGKTGTAEVGGDITPHAWFTGFGPYDQPEIVVTVLLENAGEGSTYAVPVAKEIFQWWANRQLDE